MRGPAGLSVGCQADLRGARSPGWQLGSAARGERFRILSAEAKVSAVYDKIRRACEPHPIICQLDPRDHQDTPIPRLPVVIADEAALARGTLAVDDARHAEADGRQRVERRRVEHCNSVPARLYLNREVPLESVLRRAVVEYRLERRVF